MMYYYQTFWRELSPELRDSRPQTT